MRILAVDYGQRRIGLAVTDPSGVIACPLKVVDRKNAGWKDDFRRTIDELGVRIVVVGLPKNMDGTLGSQAKYCQEFGSEVERTWPGSVEVVYCDERLTTSAAASALREGGKKNHQTKDRLDAVAASLILQTYLAQRQNMGEAADAKAKGLP